jgi:hypothetical protein
MRYEYAAMSAMFQRNWKLISIPSPGGAKLYLILKFKVSGTAPLRLG